MQTLTFFQLLTAPGSWTAPSNLAFPPSVFAWGPGGAGGSSLHGSHAGGSGGSGSLGGELALQGVAPGGILTVTITSATTTVTGGAVTVTGNPGGAGAGQSGGSAGTAPGNSISQAGTAGINGGTGSAVNGAGGAGAPGLDGSLNPAAGSAGSGSAGGTGGGLAPYQGGTGGSGGGTTANGLPGGAPGAGGAGGGSGGSINHTGGAGALGQVLIIWTVYVLPSSFRGAPGITTGRSASSRGAPVTGAAPPGPPAPFTPPGRAPRGAPGGGRGRSASSRGAPRSPTPAPFTPPRRAPRGAPGAGPGHASGMSSRGAPVTPTPAPFTPPRRAPRGAPGAGRGRALSGLSSRGAPVIAPPTPKTLLISLAAAAGTDDYGTAFPQGIFASAGIIEGPEIIGSDAFYYSGAAPAFGTLIASIAAVSGTDSKGNAYLAGAASYLSGGTYFASVVTGGSVSWFTAPGAGGPWTFIGNLEIDAAGSIFINFTDTQVTGTMTVTGNATFDSDVTVGGPVLSVGNGSVADIALNPKIATPPNLAAVVAQTATLAQTQACLGALVQSLQNRQVVN